VAPLLLLQSILPAGQQLVVPAVSLFLHEHRQLATALAKATRSGSKGEEVGVVRVMNRDGKGRDLVPKAFPLFPPFPFCKGGAKVLDNSTTS
jgi:hypothetical protein